MLGIVLDRKERKDHSLSEIFVVVVLLGKTGEQREI